MSRCTFNNLLSLESNCSKRTQFILKIDRDLWTKKNTTLKKTYNVRESDEVTCNMTHSLNATFLCDSRLLTSFAFEYTMCEVVSNGQQRWWNFEKTVVRHSTQCDMRIYLNCVLIRSRPYEVQVVVIFEKCRNGNDAFWKKNIYRRGMRACCCLLLLFFVFWKLCWQRYHAIIFFIRVFTMSRSFEFQLNFIAIYKLYLNNSFLSIFFVVVRFK